MTAKTNKVNAYVSTRVYQLILSLIQAPRIGEIPARL